VRQRRGVEFGCGEVAKLWTFIGRSSLLLDQLRALGWQPTDIACQAPSSNTARPAASSIALHPFHVGRSDTAVRPRQRRWSGLRLGGEQPHDGEHLPEQSSGIEAVMFDRIGARNLLASVSTSRDVRCDMVSHRAR
jgi:hypothetical protein